MEKPRTRISAPRIPAAPAPFRFPIFATVAPMFAAIMMWMITSSPFALLFAALGPVTALASLADSRRGSRRTARQELRRFEVEAATTQQEIESSHANERLARSEFTPGAGSIVARNGADPYRWKAKAQAPVLVTLGSGPAPSTLDFDHSAEAAGLSPLVTKTITDLQRRAAVIGSAPVTVDARLGIGVCGPLPLATAVARAIAVQLAWALSPATHWCAATGMANEAEWLERLPHRQGGQPARNGACIQFGVIGDDDALATVAVARARDSLPGACAVVLQLGNGMASAAVAESPGAAATIVEHPDRAERRSIRIEPLSIAEASAWAPVAAADAEREGLVQSDAHLASAVQLTELLRAAAPRRQPGLACEIGRDELGPVTIDLVADGPHAVIGGTTGSGKSELLVSWVLAMAATSSPQTVTFLLVDFKGGSAFASLASLPHVVGIVTDLDQAAATRALASLRAELRYRERELATSGAKSIDESARIPRLVIIVDEFATMMTDHPDLHTLFADIAARGRSLGVHLVLCTQRPAGAVRDSVLANADLRISLRVNNRADSSAVVNTDAAAEIPAHARGRGILSVASRSARLVQFAISEPADVDVVAGRWTHTPPPRRPWCEPLPAEVSRAELGGVAAGIAFGLTDLPHEQRREIAAYDPRADGHLVALGGLGSGKSTLLALLATNTPAAQLVPSAAGAAWDTVADLTEQLEIVGDATDRLVLIDDIDSLLARFGGDHRAAFIERLSRLLRDGPARGIRFVLAAQRLTADTQALAALAPSRIMLRHATRQDHVLAGGDGQQFVAELPPGGGVWRGHRVQIASGAEPSAPSAPAAPAAVPDDSRPLAIVSTRTASLLGRLATLQSSVVVELAAASGDHRELAQPHHGRRPIVLGDVDEWQSRWGALSALRPFADILFDGCSVADFRALTRSRELPPPLSNDRGLCWKLNDDGTASRARLPGG